MGVLKTAGGCLNLIFTGATFCFVGMLLKNCYHNMTQPQTDFSSDIPGATADFVKTQLAKDPTMQKKTAPRPSGKFIVDILTRHGPDKRFTFNIKPRNNRNEILMDIKETGDKASTIGGMLRFNVIFWDPAQPDHDGLSFQICFNDEQGVFIRPAEKTLKTIYVANKERICTQLAQRDVHFYTLQPNLKHTHILSNSRVLLPENLMPIKKSVIQNHNKFGRAIELIPQHTR